MESVCHALFHSDAMKIFRSSQIERTNDNFVDDRRSWTPAQTLAEYERWSGWGMTVLGGYPELLSLGFAYRSQSSVGSQQDR